MTLPELSIRRHVLAVMISAVMVLFGLVGYQSIGTDRIPNIDFPVVNVMVTMPGANPEVMDASVTAVIERAINTVPGIDHIQSTSVPGVSMVNIIFFLDKDIDVAFNEVQAKVNTVRRLLPEDAEDPVVQKVEADAQAIMWLALTGDRTPQQLSTYARNVIRPQLENINGVGEVMIGGGVQRNIRIEVDPARLAAYGLTVEDLINAIRNEHIQLPGGFLVAGDTERLIKLNLEYHSAEALSQLIVASQNGALIRLRDLAQVVDALADRRSLARYSREPTVGLGIIKISGSNTVAIIEEVKRRVDQEIRPQLPPGLEIRVATDQAHFILEMVDSLYYTLAFGVLFAGLVLWLFLKNLRSTLIVVLSIPISLAAIIAVVYFFGYTLNMLTMLAMLLLIGVVVDDSIVVLENIYRHREEGQEDAVAGAISGSNEVFFAVIATTLALVAIFVPVLFMAGIIGRFLESFAVVVTLGVVASSVVALTLTPMLCSRFLRVQPQHGRTYQVLENAFRTLEQKYRWLLALGLKYRGRTMLATVVFFFATIAILATGNLGGEFAPEEDAGQFVVSFRTPLGAGIEYTDAKLKEIEDILAAQEGVYGFFAAIGLGGGGGQVNQGIVFVRLLDRDQRVLSQRQIMNQVQARFANLAGVRAIAAPAGMVGGGQQGGPLQFNLRGPDINELSRLSLELESRLRDRAEFSTFDLVLNQELPQLNLVVDRERARQLGLSAVQVARAANVLMGGIDVARFNDDPGDGERYNIRLKAAEGTIRTADDLTQLYLRASNGDMVRLDALARLEPAVGPASINRYDLQYAASFNATPTIALSAAADLVREEAAQILPSGYGLNMVGQVQEFERTVQAVMLVFVLAVVLVYMVLASQFNSFLQPVIILVALPVAMSGGIFGLWLFNHSLNVFSMIGLVLLVGLVTKNGILLVDLTNQYREKRGMNVNQALLEACPVRLRPVLMTSFTLILAMLPAALGAGAGSETQGPMAVAIISGMVFSMLLTLVAVPAAYSLLIGSLLHGEGRLEQPATDADTAEVVTQ